MKSEERLLLRGSLWEQQIIVNYRTLRHWTGSLQAAAMPHHVYTLADSQDLRALL